MTNISYHQIKNTGVTIEQLYNEQKQLRVHFSANENEYTLVVVGRDEEPDFLLSSFGGNYYVRSNKGMNRQKYTSLKGIEKAVERLANKNLRNVGVISYSVSDDINPF